MQLEYTPIRLQAVLIGQPPVPPIDYNTGSAPQWWRCSSVGIAVGLFDALGNPLDLGNLAPGGSLQLSLYRNQGDPVPVWTKTIVGSSLYPLITTAGWQNGSQQNANFLLSAGDTDQGLDGGQSRAFWLVLNGNSVAGNLILYAAGTVTIFNAATQLPPSSLPTPSFHETFQSVGNSTITPTSNLHTEQITVSGSARTSNLIISQAGLAIGARLDLLIVADAAVTGIIFQIFIGSLGGPNPFAFDTSGGSKRGIYRFVFDGANYRPVEQLNPAY